MLTRRELEQLIEKTQGAGRIRLSLYCAECGYSLRSLPYVYRCPECGNPYNAHASSGRGVRYDIEPEPVFWLILVMMAWWGGAAISIALGLIVFSAATSKDSVVALVFAVLVGAPGLFMVRPGWSRLCEHLQLRRLSRHAAEERRAAASSAPNPHESHFDSPVD